MTYWMLPSFLFALSILDVRSRKIPNYSILVMAFIGLSLTLLPSSAISLSFALMGFALGLVVFLIPFLLGAMGAADVKVFAVTGLYLGPFDILNAFVYSLLSGGVLALFYWLYAMVNGYRIAGWRLFHLNKKKPLVTKPEASNQVTLPYVVAIFFGVLITNLTTNFHH